MPSEIPATDCRCPGPEEGQRWFFCERHQVRKTASYLRLCQSKPAYFAAWEEGRGPGQKQPIAPLRIDPLEEAPAGVGTELKAIFKRMLRLIGRVWPAALEFDGCGGCGHLAGIMNAWGPAGCRERMDLILEQIEGRARAHGLPFSRFIVRKQIILAIRRAERSAKRPD